MTDDRTTTIDEFQVAVNMTVKELESWLKTEESKGVGQKDDGGESVGHEYGRAIVRLLGKQQGDYTGDDQNDMRKVTGYVHRHLAQRPNGNVAATPWRYSLKNWGHDPMKS